MPNECVNRRIDDVSGVGTRLGGLAHRCLGQSTCLGAPRNHFKTFEDSLAMPVKRSVREITLDPDSTPIRWATWSVAACGTSAARRNRPVLWKIFSCTNNAT